MRRNPNPTLTLTLALTNVQNFLPALEGEGGCYDNPDACAAFKYYTESVYSLWPVSGPVVGGSDVTVTGEFSPGYDGVRTSARCLLGLGLGLGLGLLTLTLTLTRYPNPHAHPHSNLP